ncbi:hypothetical protein [Paenibacillus sp. MBLB4367]|uniref:hypothetical protein n=1 Tax=Paenibacillus sp. MBLB4367 TaxID=3384767 RepID=UPI0039081997
MEEIVMIVILIGIIISLRQAYLFFKKDIPRMKSAKINCTECGRDFKDIEVLMTCPHCGTKYIRHVTGEIKRKES